MISSVRPTAIIAGTASIANANAVAKKSRATTSVKPAVNPIYGEILDSFAGTTKKANAELTKMLASVYTSMLMAANPTQPISVQFEPKIGTMVGFLIAAVITEMKTIYINEFAHNTNDVISIDQLLEHTESYLTNFYYKWLGVGFTATNRMHAVHADIVKIAAIYTNQRGLDTNMCSIAIDITVQMIKSILGLLMIVQKPAQDRVMKATMDTVLHNKTAAVPKNPPKLVIRSGHIETVLELLAFTNMPETDDVSDGVFAGMNGLMQGWVNAMWPMAKKKVKLAGSDITTISDGMSVPGSVQGSVAGSVAGDEIADGDGVDDGDADDADEWADANAGEELDRDCDYDETTEW